MKEIENFILLTLPSYCTGCVSAFSGLECCAHHVPISFVLVCSTEHSYLENDIQHQQNQLPRWHFSGAVCHLLN